MGAPCRTKDEMDQLPVVVVVVVSLKSQHPSQKLSSSEHAPVQDRYMYLTIPTFLFRVTHGVKKPWFHKSLKTLSVSQSENYPTFFQCILRIKVHVGRCYTTATYTSHERRAPPFCHTT